MNTTIVRAGSDSQLTAWPSAIQCATFAPSFLRLRLGLRFRFGLRLRPVLPRLRGYGYAINGSSGVAFGAGMRVPAAPVADLPFLGLGLLDEPLQFLDCRGVHLDHAP